jgi:hypothetical protein
MRPKCDLIFEQTDRGTRVTFRGDSNPVGPFKLLSPLFNRKGQQVWAQRLGRIKTVLETFGPLASVLVRPSLAASRMAAEAGRRGHEAGVTSRLQRD